MGAGKASPQSGRATFSIAKASVKASGFFIGTPPIMQMLSDPISVWGSNQLEVLREREGLD